MKTEITETDFQKLLQIALQSLTIQRTLLENEAAELNNELRTLERDDDLEKLDRALIALNRDYEHYLAMVDNKHPFKLDAYYE
ncbi:MULTISPECIES: hypothetical protein [Lactococcus]|uniref:Uncharacterized protein n=2 Tax=Lactococcus TaxID=1357 RepID=A0A387BJX1_9LACT|nr:MULTISPECIES: hypothetical protein [Lactococcus]AYG01539.1 hypothetical protein D7I46_10975 [Lactococcus allomyrinae]MCL2112379.1 hypothetical protein [Streptococcaceae bacterium]QDK70442.1 hypothetical protein FLP15_03710 [Lactococcus protaetiae]